MGAESLIQSLVCRLLGHKWGGTDHEWRHARLRYAYRWCARCGHRDYFGVPW